MQPSCLKSKTSLHCSRLDNNTTGLHTVPVRPREPHARPRADGMEAAPCCTATHEPPPSALRPPAAFQAHRRTSISSAWPVCSSAAWCMGRGLATQPGDDPLDFFIHNHRNSYTSTQRDDKSNIKITFYKLPVIFHNAFWCLSIPLDFGTYVSLYSDPLKKCLWHSCRLKASSWCKRNRSHLMKFQQSLAFTIEWWKLVGNRNE